MKNMNENIWIKNNMEIIKSKYGKWIWIRMINFLHEKINTNANVPTNEKDTNEKIWMKKSMWKIVKLNMKNEYEN